MATLVKFVKDKKGMFEGEITAIFPQLKYNKFLYGNDRLVAYVHLGQHTCADKEWIKEKTIPATASEYGDLLRELVSIGYTDLKICK